MAKQEQVTVVVATRDRWAELRTSLPRHQAPVVVVDNGSSDGTARRVRDTFPHVSVIELSSNAGAVARNEGVRVARTPYVAFADDDSWWEPGALQHAAAVLDAHPRLAVLAARMLVGPQERLDDICQAMSRAPLGCTSDLPGPSVLGFLACGVVVRRDAFLSVGGYDSVIFFCGEEERLALDLAAAGWGLAYVDKVVGHHHPSPARNPRIRKVLAARNRVLTAVLRRPPKVVLRTVREVAGEAGWQALGAAALRAPRALRHRRLLPPHVEAERALLDEPVAEPAGAWAPGG